MPVTVDDFFKRAPGLTKYFAPAPDLKRRAAKPQGDEADRQRFLRDLSVQIGYAKEFQAANAAAGYAVPTMPERKGRQGARKFWFIVRDGHLYLQIFLGNLGLLECYMETGRWDDLINGLEAMKDPVKEGGFDILFKRVRAESKERRQRKLESKGQAPVTAIAAEHGAAAKAAEEHVGATEIAHVEDKAAVLTQTIAPAPSVTETVSAPADMKPKKPRRSGVGKASGKRAAPGKQ